MKPINKKALSVKNMLIATVRNHQKYRFPKEYLKDIRWLVDELEREINNSKE